MTEFIIEAAELTPALRALAPLTRNLQKGEPVEGKACEMIYCRFTHEGELLLVTADHLFQTAAAIKLPISGFDGDMCEFAIGREKIKQITNVFKPYKDDPLPVRVTVDRLHTSLGKMEDVITFTELDTLHSPASLSFAGEEYQEIPYRQILKSLGKIRRAHATPLGGALNPETYGKLAYAARTYSVDATVAAGNAIYTLLGDRMIAVTGLHEIAGEKSQMHMHTQLAMLSEQMEIIADQIEGTDPLEMDDEERTPATNDDAGESLRESAKQFSAWLHEETKELAESVSNSIQKIRTPTQDEFGLAPDRE